MSRQEKVRIETRHHEDGAVSHHMTFANGQKEVVLVKSNHVLAQRFIALGSRNKLMAVVNSSDDSDKAVEKVRKISTAWDEGKWGLQGEGEEKGAGLARALAELGGISLDEAKGKVAALSRAQQAKLRGTERIAALLAKYRSEDGDEADALLDGLIGTSEEGDEEEKEVA